MTAEQAEDELLKLATVKFNESNGKIHFKDCISLVLKADKKLAKKYESKFR